MSNINGYKTEKTLYTCEFCTKAVILRTKFDVRTSIKQRKYGFYKQSNITINYDSQLT